MGPVGFLLYQIVKLTFWKQGLKTLYKRNPLLFNIGILHLGLALVSLIGLGVDPRLVGGINPWIKPIKFDLSILIYVWTMAWILYYLPQRDRRNISIGITISMLIETLCIGVQAAKGVRSHFNVSSLADGMVFNLMGVTIAYNTYLLGKTLHLFIRKRPALPKSYRLGIQFGLVSIILGSFIGAFMSAHMSHVVGYPDGGAGLPFLNWSTEGGDLRIAHFIGLHGLQLLVFLSYWLSKSKLSEVIACRVVSCVFWVHLVFTSGILILALFGKPMFVL